MCQPSRIAAMLVAWLLSSGVALSQTTPAALTASTPQGAPAKPLSTPNDTLVSPQVSAEGRVTFRLYAPEAKNVSLRCNSDFFRTPPKFVKDEQGIWSATTEPAASGAYRYNFIVDGATVLDSRNPKTSPLAGSVQSLVEVSRGPDDFQGNQPGVAHGTVSTVYYESSAFGTQRRLHLYLPPDYEQGRDYPVLYLIHGGGDDDEAWPTAGRVGFILDNLIAAGKAKPMVVVLPNGGPQPKVSDPDKDPFTPELMTVIIPYIEAKYRVSKLPEDRALAGLSMGGNQTLHIGLTHTRQFRYLGIFSAGWNLPNQKSFQEKFGRTLPQEAARLKLVWYGYGTTDISRDNAISVLKMLDGYGIKYTAEETPGGHVWANWRLYLSQFAPLLFR